jgi:hypothetical protein
MCLVEHFGRDPTRTPNIISHYSLQITCGTKIAYFKQGATFHKQQIQRFQIAMNGWLWCARVQILDSVGALQQPIDGMAERVVDLVIVENMMEAAHIGVFDD